MTELEILKDIGWFENRRTNITYMKEYLTKKGYSWFPKVDDFFSEFGGLKSEKLHFDPIEAEKGVDSSWILSDYANRLNKTELCIIGQAFNNHLTLFMTDSGKIYGGFDDFLCYIAIDPKSAIIEIYLQTNFEEII